MDHPPCPGDYTNNNQVEQDRNKPWRPSSLGLPQSRLLINTADLGQQQSQQQGGEYSNLEESSFQFRHHQHIDDKYVNRHPSPAIALHVSQERQPQHRLVSASTKTRPPSSLSFSSSPVGMSSSSCSAVAADVSTAKTEQENSTSHDMKRRRLCKFPNCSRVVKSQGHCQRHGAKPKRCKMDGCDKQAQGTHDGMCKRHWRRAVFPEEEVPTVSAAAAMELHKPANHSSGSNNSLDHKSDTDMGCSVYDTILPQSLAYKPNHPVMRTSEQQQQHDQHQQQYPQEGTVVMPLVEFLRKGADREFGWHRVEERRARGCSAISSVSIQFETWERQLVLVEILLLSGGTPLANFRDLAHAWGRDKGFHTALAHSIFERRGDMERKRRSDLGKVMSEEQKNAYRTKGKRRKSVALVTTTTTKSENQPTNHPQQHQAQQQQPQHYDNEDLYCQSISVQAEEEEELDEIPRPLDDTAMHMVVAAMNDHVDVVLGDCNIRM